MALVCTCDAYIGVFPLIYKSQSFSKSCPSSLDIFSVFNHNFCWSPGHSLPHSVARIEVLPSVFQSSFWIIEIGLNKYPVIRTLAFNNKPSS